MKTKRQPAAIRDGKSAVPHEKLRDMETQRAKDVRGGDSKSNTQKKWSDTSSQIVGNIK